MRLLLTAALAALVLGGCSGALARSGNPAAGREAFVNVAALVPAHPLYAQVVQYDRQIAALQASEASLPSLASQSQPLDVVAAAARMRAISGRPTDASLTQSSLGPDMQRTYANQMRSFDANARGSMADFQNAIAREEAAQLAAYSRSLKNRVQLAYDARAQALRESESTYGLTLAEHDATRVLLLRLRLGSLALSGPQRRTLQRELAAVSRRQEHAVAIRREADQRVLSAYEARIEAQSASQFARQAARIQSAAATVLATRQRVLALQVSGRRPPPLPSGAWTAPNAADARGSGASAAALQSAAIGINARFRLLAASDRTDRRRAASELARLQHDRAALRHAIGDAILRDAQRVARIRGLGSVTARMSPGAIDLSSAVRSDLIGLRV